MPTFTVKNIPDELLDRLKRAAETHRRSVNSEILTRLERSLGVTPAPAEILATARTLRQAIGGPPLTLAELDRAKSAGRP